MSLHKGDFVIVDYTAKVKETNEVFDTTSEEAAKKEHLYKEGELYEPKLVVIGEGWVLKALDDSLTTLKLEKLATVEISQDKAFGARDPEKVKRVPLKQLLARDINPTLGARIEYGGKTATVRAVGAGRVLLDFNPALAGKTLVYEITIKKKLEEIHEKISALIHRRVSAVESSKFEFTVKTKAVTIDMPEDAFYLEGIQVAKRGIALDIQKFLPTIDMTKFVEVFKRPPEKTLPSKAETPQTTAGTEKAEKAATRTQEKKPRGKEEAKAPA